MFNAASQFRELLLSEEIIVLPPCYDPFTARLAEQAGFKCVYVGGYSLGAHLCVTEPLLTLSEITQSATRIQAAVQVPAIVDVGAGYGEAINVWHTVRQLEATGVAGLHIEDQVYPKRAHYHRDYREHVIGAEHMVEKIKAAVEARRNSDFLIIARTDAMRTDGFDEGVRRAKAYVAAGTDLVIIFPNNLEEARQAPREIQAPLVYVSSHGNRVGRPILTVPELAEMGYKMVIFPTITILTFYEAVKELFERLQRTGDPGLKQERMIPARKATEDLIGLAKLYEIEERTTERQI